MSHTLMYHGGYERNYAALRAGARTFRGSDESERPLDWPAEANGVRVGYMEQPGKNFVAVRVLDDASDVVLAEPVLLDLARHMGYGKRFSAEPTIVGDDEARALLDDAIARNPAQRAELTAIRDRHVGQGRAGR